MLFKNNILVLFYHYKPKIEVQRSYLLLILGVLFLVATQESFAEESSDASINELVDEYLGLIEKLDKVGTTVEDLVVSPDLFNEIIDDLDRIEQIVIELQTRGYDGEANAERIGQQMVGTVTFFNQETDEILFETQIPNGILGIFASIGLFNEFASGGVDMTFEQKTAFLKSGLGIVTVITTFEDEGKADDIASSFVLASIGAFHPNVDNDTIKPDALFEESFLENPLLSPNLAFAATDYSEMTDEELIDRWEELLTTDMETEMQDAMELIKAGEMDKALAEDLAEDFARQAEELDQQMTEWWNESQEILEELKKRGYEFEAGVLTTDGLMSPIVTISKPILTNDVISPRIQVKHGVAPSDVICNDGLELVFKNSDNSPACVKPKTAEKLIERGWASS